MAVPGIRMPSGTPEGLVDTELFAVDAYRREFDAMVVDVDRANNRVALTRTAFYPGGGGQPHDVGTLAWDDGSNTVVKVRREAERIWHWVDGDELPDPHA
ncbi:MAG: hypothetical protein J2P20_11865, partial [Pseudonocardia sp.]|nr:hypothetical protein [Pseudonocardia sp.]